MHTEEFILISKRMFITKQPQKSEIFENPQYKNKATQLSLMQRNKLREDVGKTDEVIQTDPNKFEDEEKMEASSDDSEMDPIVTKKPTVESFESIMKNVKFKEDRKIKRAEFVLVFILQSTKSLLGKRAN